MNNIYKISQTEETRLKKVISHMNYRYAYARAYETQEDNESGQDYLTFQENDHSFTFALCDGVGLSFCGEIAASFLGEKLREWMAGLELELDEAEMQQKLVNYLHSLTSEGTELVQKHPLPVHIIGIHREVLEEKRVKGSATTYICGKIDLKSRKIVLAWQGDSRIRLWGQGDEQTSRLGDYFHTVERWSTRTGPVHGEPHLFITDLKQIDRIMLYSDGLVMLDFYSTPPSDEELESIIEQSEKKPTSDDISFLDIWWTK